MLIKVCPKSGERQSKNDFLLIFFYIQSKGATQSSILMILRHPLARGSVFDSTVQPFPPGPKITDPGPPGLLFSVDSAALVVEGTVGLLLYGDLVGAVVAPGPDTSSGEVVAPAPG